MHELTILTTGLELVALIIIVLAFMIYNNLIRLRNNVSRAWSNIDVLLEKRHDLIPNLIEVVKGYSKYEKTLLVQLTSMRSSLDKVEDGSSQDKMATSSNVSKTVKTLFANVEKYPDLKANDEFVELQKALVEIEDEIADSRTFYNDSVKIYNTNITVVPYDFFAAILSYKPLPYFTASDSDKQPIAVDTA